MHALEVHIGFAIIGACNQIVVTCIHPNRVKFATQYFVWSGELIRNKNCPGLF